MSTRLTIVTTLYNSAPYVHDFYHKMMGVAEKHFDKKDITLIYVDDGSPDNSLELAIDLSQRDNRVEVIELSRNFGHHKAIMSGLQESEGDLVFLIDCDLEEDPELLSVCLSNLDENTDVVYGVQEKRKGNFFERLTGNIFYTIFNALSDIPLPRNLSTIRLMRIKYVKALLRHQETEFIIACVWQITGFHQTPFIFKKKAKGNSSYNVVRKISIALQAIISFSSKPLAVISIAGIIITLFTGLFVVYTIARKLFYGVTVEGWVSIVASILLIGGLNLFATGVIGLYLSTVFKETKNRPFSIVRNHYKSEK